MANPIPDGYELVSGRDAKAAREALNLAAERGIDPSEVLSRADGWAVPLKAAEAPYGVLDFAGHNAKTDEERDALESGEVTEPEEIHLPTKSTSKGDTEAFASEWNIDLSGTSNQDERVAAITAEVERRTAINDAEIAAAKSEGRTPVLIDLTKGE